MRGQRIQGNMALAPIGVLAGRRPDFWKKILETNCVPKEEPKQAIKDIKCAEYQRVDDKTFDKVQTNIRNPGDSEAWNKIALEMLMYLHDYHPEDRKKLLLAFIESKNQVTSNFSPLNAPVGLKNCYKNIIKSADGRSSQLSYYIGVYIDKYLEQIGMYRLLKGVDRQDILAGYTRFIDDCNMMNFHGKGIIQINLLRTGVVLGFGVVFGAFGLWWVSAFLGVSFLVSIKHLIDSYEATKPAGVLPESAFLEHVGGKTDFLLKTVAPALNRAATDQLAEA